MLKELFVGAKCPTCHTKYFGLRGILDAEKCFRTGTPKPKFPIGQIRHNECWAFKILSIYHVKGRGGGHQVHYEVQDFAQKYQGIWRRSERRIRKFSETKVGCFTNTISESDIV